MELAVQPPFLCAYYLFHLVSSLIVLMVNACFISQPYVCKDNNKSFFINI